MDGHRDTGAQRQKEERILFGNAATSALATGRRILQVKCYRNRYVPVNIILRATENTDFKLMPSLKFPIWDCGSSGEYGPEERGKRSSYFRIALQTPSD
jgi:hypothetical protein